jgi:hypothetical protein
LLRSAILLIILGLGRLAFAQISPPGLEDTHVVLWGALAVNQQIARKWSVMAYVGGSRESNPDNLSVLRRQAIVVINQETQYQFNDRWQLSFGTSLRSQNRYREDTPFLSDDPDLRNEIRYYLRLFYRNHIGKTAFTYSFRPEYRQYYDPDWNVWSSTPLELRFRLKAQANIPLNASKSNQFIIANELLSTTDHRNANGELYWSTYKMSEDRVTTYLRHTFKRPSLFLDVGYMSQIIVGDKPEYIGHLAFDLILQNPFGKPASLK